MRRFLFALLVASLVAAPAASAGGWATAGLAPPSDGLAAGDTWKAEVTILQHGRTPLDGVKPSVLISNGDTQKSFPARPTGKPGVYAAEVKFPSAGTWNYAVYDGFEAYGGAQTHRFAPVTIGPSGDGGGFGFLRFGTGLTAAVAAAALLLFALPRLSRRLQPAPALH